MTTPRDPFAAPGDQPPPGWGAPPPYGYAPAGTRTNALAIVSLVAAFFCQPAGLVCGIIALSQVKKTGESGRGMAIAGIVISALVIVGFLGLFLLGTLIGGTIHSCTTVFPEGTTSC